MTILSIHSFQRGTGKSSLTANVAALLALDGRRVGVVDCDFQQPGVHLLFGLRDDEISHSLNDYLDGQCALGQTVVDVTARLQLNAAGRVFLAPASVDPAQSLRFLRDGYDVNRLNEGFYQLLDEFRLEALLVDTQAGLSETTLPSLAVADRLAIVLRLDRQDYQGTAVAVDVARRLEVPRLWLVVNQAAPTFDLAEVAAQVEQTYKCDVAGVLPHSEELMALAGRGIFALKHPADPLTALYRTVAARLME